MKMNKFNIMILFVFVYSLSTNIVSGQAIMKPPVSVDTPLQISKSISEIISDPISEIKSTTKTVDFDGDGSLDYIVLVTNIYGSDYANELWYTSSYKLVKNIRLWVGGYDYKWFVNIDEDPEPEIISAAGYPEGIDYTIYDQDIVEWTQNILFRFNPVLIDSSNKMQEYYWGYPWDISNIITNFENGVTKIRCSFDHDIVRDGEIDIPEWQNYLPAIFFTGKTTQPTISVGNIKKVEWLTLENIELNSKK